MEKPRGCGDPLALDEQFARLFPAWLSHSLFGSHSSSLT